MDTIAHGWSVIIAFLDAVVNYVDQFVTALPNDLVLLLIILLGASTFTLSKRCKQLNSMTNDWRTIAKSFEAQVNKLKHVVSDLESKSDS